MKNFNELFQLFSTKHLLFVIISGLVLLLGCSEYSEVPVLEDLTMDKTYKNHFTLPVKPLAEVADPFIMRYNGWYYLYCTGEVNIWKSKDLAQWIYVGTANPKDPLPMAFAPEVYYWNGKFYMYTSPSGKGHYIYVSNQPTGPFVRASENLGMFLDGSVFIDDDGSWYFTHCNGNSGIMGHTMKSPLEIDKKGKTLNAYMGEWTEGPMIIKRDGRYFMLYTGTHYKSDAYREKYAVAEDGPLGTYTTPDHNPILLSNHRRSHALGHACFVLGPDLDSMYIAYHSYTGLSEGRVMNIDRLAFNGERMVVNGPTLHEMPVAELPEFALWPEANPALLMDRITADDTEMFLSKEKTGDTFTAELNFSGGDGDTGVVVCKSETDTYFRILWPMGQQTLQVEKVDHGQIETMGQFQLPDEFTQKALHTIKVQYSPKQMDIYFDYMHKFTLENPGAAGGSIGYVFTGKPPMIGFTGYSSAYKGSSDHESVKPVPSKFDAIHHMAGEGRGFGGAVDEKVLPGDIRSLWMTKKNAWASYKVNVKEEGVYGVALAVRNDFSDGAKLEVFEDGVSKGVFSLERPHMLLSSDSRQSYTKIPLEKIQLQKGLHVLTLQVREGKNLEILSVETYSAEDDDLPVEDSLTEKEKKMTVRGSKQFYFDKDGMSNPDLGDIKMTVGDGTWTDFVVDVDVTPGKMTVGRSGLLIRSINETYFQYQTVNAFQGYFVGLGKGNVFIQKMNYEDSESPIKKDFSVKTGTTYHLRVEATKNRIKVYVDDMENPIIDYFDHNPYLYGKVGIWSYKDYSVFKNLKAVKWTFQTYK